MEPQQELEWMEAQKIAVSVDLEGAAKRQLRFLAAVDRNRHLYDGSALKRSIYRYNACWLPLLAKHSESRIFEGPLVVPLDCEWVWHCHRLNPVRYKSDCEELYGRILDNFDVVSTVEGVCGTQTEETWNKLYPDEPYNVDLANLLPEDISERTASLAKYTKYDLISAAKRQSPFFYQVSRPHMKSDLFIKEAVARYKGFLYLIKRNKENGIKRFSVPTYDIDLIWHSHQLHPTSYCKDLNEALGKVLEHDDMDSDRAKGKKLDVGFSGTTKQWEDTFGTRYWKAGAMYRGNAPSPITSSPYSPSLNYKKVVSSNEHPQENLLQDRKIMEVLLEFVGVKNLPEGQERGLYVLFSKSQPDAFFDDERRLSILSESKEKQVASFQCEPTGELHFELMSHSSSNFLVRRSAKALGSASFSVKDYLGPASQLYVEKWLELVPSSGAMSSKPISLRVAISFTVPVPAPYMLEMNQSRPFKNACFFNLPVMPQHTKSWTHVTDETGTRFISLQMRDLKDTKNMGSPGKEVVGLMNSGETQTLAQSMEDGWSVMDNLWLFRLPNKCKNDAHLFELTGKKMVKLFPGRKLAYELRHHGKQANEKDFLTAVEFSIEDPYGKAVALLDLRSRLVTAKEKWMMLPGIILAFIASHMMKKEGYEGIIAKGKDLKVKGADEEKEGTELKGVEFNCNVSNGAKGSTKNIGFSSAGGCENAVKSGGCGGCSAGGCGGGGCGNMVKSGGCGSGCGGGCGGGCGNMVQSGGCGSGCGGGCGGGCGNMLQSGGCGSGCGGGCGGGCGNMVQSGGCGGCGGGCGGCGGGCGNHNMMESGGCGGCGGCGGGGCGSSYMDSKCGVGEHLNVEQNYVNEAIAA